MRAESPDNVSNLIAKPAAKYSPEPRYVSKYREKIIRSSKRGKSAHKTLGVPSVPLDPPGQFLQKRSKSLPKKPQIRHERYHRAGQRSKLPEWRKVGASELEKQANEKNRVDFAKKNVDEAKRQRASKPRKYFVDDRHGNVQSLIHSGMYPYYRNRKDYGQMPEYIMAMFGKRVRSEKGGSSPRRAATRREDKSRTRGKHGRSGRQGTPSPGRQDDGSRGRKRGDTRKQAGRSERDKSKKGHVPDGRAKEDEYDKTRLKNQRKNGRDVSPRRGGGGPSSRKKSPRKGPGEGGTESSRGSGTPEDGSRANENVESRSDLSRVEKEERVSTASTDRLGYKQPRCRYVTEDERAKLLQGMKMKWDETMKEFQCLPFLTDTPPKAKRKSRMEKYLGQLEKDIETIERHPYIYVYSDPED